MGILENKAVLVTGGSRGIGAAIVRRAMEEGAQVAFTYHSRASEAESLAQELAAEFPGQYCVPFQCDVSDVDAMEQLAGDVLERLGRLDALVNNAGITDDSVLARMSPEQWNRVIATNLGSMYAATKPFLLQMVKQKSGSIVNMTSVTAVYGNAGQANYAASKGGIIGFTKALSAEIAPFGVRVNAVAPGYIRTEMLGSIKEDMIKHVESRISIGRLGKVEDVAPLVCFLASEQAAYITGQVIQVDGGITL